MNHLNIVVIERNSAVRETLEDLLSSEGRAVQGFASVKGACANMKEGPSIVLLNSIAHPATGLGFVAVAEHEEYLLGIAKGILADSPQAEEVVEAEIPAPPESGEQAIATAVADRLLLQRAAVNRLRMEALAKSSKSGTRAAVRPALKQVSNF